MTQYAYARRAKLRGTCPTCLRPQYRRHPACERLEERRPQRSRVVRVDDDVAEAIDQVQEILRGQHHRNITVNEAIRTLLAVSSLHRVAA